MSKNNKGGASYEGCITSPETEVDTLTEYEFDDNDEDYVAADEYELNVEDDNIASSEFDISDDDDQFSGDNITASEFDISDSDDLFNDDNIASSEFNFDKPDVPEGEPFVDELSDFINGFEQPDEEVDNDWFDKHADSCDNPFTRGCNLGPFHMDTHHTALDAITELAKFGQVCNTDRQFDSIIDIMWKVAMDRPM